MATMASAQEGTVTQKVLCPSCPDDLQITVILADHCELHRSLGLVIFYNHSLQSPRRKSPGALVFRERNRRSQIAWSPTLSAILDLPLYCTLHRNSSRISRYRHCVDRAHQALRSPEQQSPWRFYSPTLRHLLRFAQADSLRSQFQRSPDWQVKPETITILRATLTGSLPGEAGSNGLVLVSTHPFQSGIKPHRSAMRTSVYSKRITAYSGHMRAIYQARKLRSSGCPPILTPVPTAPF